jgi:excisionase family DNA binding protein
VSIERAAEILGVSRRTVYYRISEGVLQTIRTRGGSQRVVVESLLHHRQH